MIDFILSYPIVIPLAFVVLALCLRYSTFWGQEQEVLTSDQKHELKAWRRLGMEGDPPFLGQKFVVPSGGPVVGLVQDRWTVVFTYKVTEKNVEQIAAALAKKYDMKAPQGNISKGAYSRMALFIGSIEAAKKLSEDPKVRQVQQHAIYEGMGIWVGGFDAL